MTDNAVGLPSTPTKKESDDVKLVRQILEKTKERKILWNRDLRSYSTFIARNNLTAEFVIVNNTIFSARSWSSFTIKLDEEPILYVTREQNLLLSLAGVSADATTSAADELFRFIDSFRQQEVKRALSAIEDL